MILLLRWRVIPGWVRMLWLYLPVLVSAYISQNYILHEVRSFWALAPIFTATLACWFDADVVQQPIPDTAGPSELPPSPPPEEPTPQEPTPEDPPPAEAMQD